MFTLAQFEKAKSVILAARGEEVYSPEKSTISFELSRLSSTDRGTAIEMMLVDTLENHGIQSEHRGGCGSDYDLSIFTGGKIVRGEVKSSLCGPKSGKYLFHGIKSGKFDMLFLVFVHPTKGIIIKSCGKKDFAIWSREYVEGREGHNVYFSNDLKSTLPTIDWDPTGQKITI